MKLTTSLIRQAANHVDFVAPIEVRSYSGRHGKGCTAIVVPGAGDLVRFGMSLAYVIATTGGEYMLEGGEVDAIDSAISELPFSQMDMIGGDVVLYWPTVPFEEPGESVEREHEERAARALFATPQITTDDNGRHRDEQGRTYRAVLVDGETTYELEGQ